MLEARYALEYGNDVLQVQADAVAPGTRVLLVDDVLATGGTLLAAQVLAQRLGAEIAGASVLMGISLPQRPQPLERPRCGQRWWCSRTLFPIDRPNQ